MESRKYSLDAKDFAGWVLLLIFEPAKAKLQNNTLILYECSD